MTTTSFSKRWLSQGARLTILATFGFSAGYGAYHFFAAGQTDPEDDGGISVPFSAVANVAEDAQIPTYLCLRDAHNHAAPQDELYQATLCYLRGVYPEGPSAVAQP